MPDARQTRILHELKPHNPIRVAILLGFRFNFYEAFYARFSTAGWNHKFNKRLDRRRHNNTHLALALCIQLTIASIAPYFKLSIEDFVLLVELPFAP